MTTPRTPWDFDVRVRERNLQKGTLSEKDVEKYLKDLEDMGDEAERIGVRQPATAGGGPDAEGG